MREAYRRKARGRSAARGAKGSGRPPPGVRPGPAIAAALAATAMVIAFAAPGCDGPREAYPFQLTVFFTAGTRGRIDPCGCPSEPLGGLSRRATVFGSRGDAARIVIDIGNTADGTGDEDLILLGFILRAYRAMGYAAVNVGRSEVALPREEIQRLAEEEKVPFVSANVVGPDRESIVPPFRIVTIEGRRAGILGIVRDDLGGGEIGNGLLVTDARAAIARFLPSLVQSAEIRILAACVPQPALGSYARAFPEFDLILGGDVEEPAQAAFLVNRSIVSYVTGQGKVVGAIRVDWDPSGSRRGDQDLVKIGPGIAADPVVEEILGEYRAAIRDADLAVDRVGPPGDSLPNRYAGPRECVPCHRDEAEVWKGSAHAGALDTLKGHDDDGRPRCLRCHTVGFGRPDGYRRKVPTELGGVQCESCHGRGQRHIDAEKARAPTGSATEQAAGTPPIRAPLRRPGGTLCETCHDGVNSDPFVFDAFWAKIRH